jgi:hypothetical protein
MRSITTLVIGAMVALTENSIAEIDLAASSRVQVVSPQPALVCTRLDGPARRELQSGQSRLVLTVYAYQPSKDGVGLVASLPTGDGNVEELSRFAIFPNQTYDAAQPGRRQRFGLPRLPASALRGKSVCVEVKFSPDETGGQATMALNVEVSPP